jgi:hypothetical protein
MPAFYFDYHYVESGGVRIEDPDDTGVELGDREVARREAATALAEIAREVFPSFAYREIGIQIRDGAGRLGVVRMTFEMFEARSGGKK